MIERKITNHLQKMLQKFPVVSLTGPRQSGKTTLLRNFFPKYKYYNFERTDHREMAQEDPVGFLKNAGEKVIFDEAQKFPDIFSYIQVISDERNTPGQYILSGSQSFLQNAKISQSMAGRVSINHLFPFDISELQPFGNFSPGQLIVNGFYPRLYDQKITPGDFYPSYLQTYIERDIRTLKNIENLHSFSQFLSLCAGRVGQVLNLSSLANDAGITVNTAKAWISLLEASFVVFLLQPYYGNFNKRIIKAPKIYFYDTGIVSSLLRITNWDGVRNHYLYGVLFENLVISEIKKYYYHQGKQPPVYYWRESNGSEIDCIIETGGNSISAIEIKAGATFNKDFVKTLNRFHSKDENTIVNKHLMYGGDISSTISGVQVHSWPKVEDFLKIISSTKQSD
jgi:predicted AAA+ superfamily ATPase